MKMYTIFFLSLLTVGVSAYHSTCQVWGDPHIRKCGDRNRITCYAPGYREYFENDYLSVYGHNHIACPGREVTYVVIVHITFYYQSCCGCWHRIHYHSNEYSVSTTFTNGQTVVNPGEANEIRIFKRGRHTHIIQRESRVVIIIWAVRSWRLGKLTYFITIHAPNALIGVSTGILVNGCCDPIDIGGIGKRSTDCDEACADVADEVKETCLFDCENTGDTEVARSHGEILEMEEAARADEQDDFSDNGTTTSNPRPTEETQPRINRFDT